MNRSNSKMSILRCKVCSPSRLVYLTTKCLNVPKLVFHLEKHSMRSCCFTIFCYHFALMIFPFIIYNSISEDDMQLGAFRSPKDQIEICQNADLCWDR